MIMRALLLLSMLSFWSGGLVAICSEPHKKIDEFMNSNYASNDSEAVTDFKSQISKVGNHFLAAFITFKDSSGDSTADAPTLEHTLFLHNSPDCTIAGQFDGEIAEEYNFAGISYVFMRRTEIEDKFVYLHYVLLRLEREKEVAEAKDQHGYPLEFDAEYEDNCQEKKTGAMVSWGFVKGEAQKLFYVLKHDVRRNRDCRVSTESFEYRYYRPTRDIWELAE